MRQGRSACHIGRKGLAHDRWIVGVTLAYVVNQYGLIVAWDCAPAHVHDSVVQPLIADFADAMVVLTDTHVHAATGDPLNLKLGTL